MDPFQAYQRALEERDLAPLTRAKYWWFVQQYRTWLGGREPTPASVQSYLAYLREKGYQPRSLRLCYVALEGFFALFGVTLKLRLRKPRTLPRYWDAGDIERLIAQAGRGLPGQTPKVRERHHALVLTLALAGLRRDEASSRRLKVGDLDFRRSTIRVRGKGTRRGLSPWRIDRMELLGRTALVVSN